MGAILKELETLTPKNIPPKNQNEISMRKNLEEN
jgi:hypothetical protein